MKEIKITLNFDKMNASIVGDYQKIMITLKDLLIEKNFSILSIDRLNIETFSDTEIKNKLKIENYKKATNIQNKIITNIFTLIDKGHKKIVICELFDLIDQDVKRYLFAYLKENGIQLINITNNMEEVLNLEYLIVFYNGQVAIEGNTLEVLKEEKLLNRIGINLPFIVDISKQLIYYNLVDKIYLNKEDLVDALWK